MCLVIRLGGTWQVSSLVGFECHQTLGLAFQVGMGWMRCILFSYFMFVYWGDMVCEDIVHLAGFPSACEPWWRLRFKVPPKSGVYLGSRK